jgi:hypothetical protein
MSPMSFGERNEDADLDKKITIREYDDRFKKDAEE